MGTSSIKNIVFDLGGVLIDWDPKRLYRKIFATEEEVDNFLSNVCTMEWNIQQDAGNSIAGATQMLTLKCPEWESQIKAYYGRWEEMLGGAIHGTVKVLEECAEDPNYRVLALTNWSHETFPIAQERFDFLQYFEGIVVSGVEKHIKPFPEIYKILLSRYNLDPTETIFIDDNADNILGAEILGIQAIQFSSPEQLRKELTDKQILS